MELANALQMVSALGLEVIKYPSGKFGFVGRVPTDLAWQMTDGSIVPEDIAADIARASIRSYAMKAHGVSTRVFATHADAVRFAESRGYIVAGVQS
jgi:hypothetical protein